MVLCGAVMAVVPVTACGPAGGPVVPVTACGAAGGPVVTKVAHWRSVTRPHGALPGTELIEHVLGGTCFFCQ